MIERLQQVFQSGRMRGAAILFVARSFNSVVSLVFTLLAGRILTVEDYGLYTQSLARIVVIQAITEAGLQFSLVRYMAPACREGDERTVAALLRASLQLKVYAGLAVMAISILLMLLVPFSPMLASAGIPLSLLPGSDPQLFLLLWLVFLGGFGMSLLSYLESLLVAREDYLRLSVWLPSVGLIRLALLGFFVPVEDAVLSAEHVIFAFALGPYVAAAAFFIFFPRSLVLTGAPPSDWHPWIRKLAGYNVWIVAASFMSILSDWMEIHLISVSVDRGLYSAARMPMQGFLILLATMQSVLLPRFSGLQTRAEFAAVFRKIYGLVAFAFVSMLPGFFVLPWFILKWFGPHYSPAVEVFYIIYPNFLLRLFFAPLGTALYALDQTKLIAAEAGLRMVSGFALNMLLIPEYGINGAAAAGLASQFFGWGFLLYCYWQWFTKGRFPWSGQSQPRADGPSHGEGV